jgi:hypothetical protein
MSGMKSRAPRRPSRIASADSAAQSSAPTLPAWKAFTVQFSTETDASSGLFSGRVEHLNSGRRARFGSRQELLAVLERLLDQIEPPSK